MFKASKLMAVFIALLLAAPAAWAQGPACPEETQDVKKARAIYEEALIQEATGNLDNMRRTRECCGGEYTILSGDDGITFSMLTDPAIHAQGVISVVSNVVPGPVGGMVQAFQEGRLEDARTLNEALSPIFGLVTVTTQEETPYGPVTCRARNPLAIKALMNILGMPSGPHSRATIPASYFGTSGICASILSGRHMIELITALPFLF